MSASEGELFFQVVSDYIAILITIKSIYFNGAPIKSQGQLAGFVVDEAHCVRYGLFQCIRLQFLCVG